jgi:hypothetical protein
VVTVAAAVPAADSAVAAIWAAADSVAAVTWAAVEVMAAADTGKFPAALRQVLLLRS